LKKASGFRAVVVAYYAQYVLDLLKPENTVLEELARSRQIIGAELRRILADFYSADDVRKTVAVLSAAKGGLPSPNILMQPSTSC